MSPAPRAPNKIRVDQLLVQTGLAPSRERAQALVLAGKVFAGDQRIDKPSQLLNPLGTSLRVKGKDHPFVGRGGVKLAGALDHFGIQVSQKICLDVGASTGGFTDCLLQRGAQRVYTLDSGTNQLDYKIRSHPRVVAREKFNVRHLSSRDLPEAIDLIVVDVSFISLKLVLPPLLAAVPGPWDILCLIKPQFEAGREQVAKGGIVKDKAVQQQVVADISRFFENSGLKQQGHYPAPITGDKGNQEFFLHARQNKSPSGAQV